MLCQGEQDQGEQRVCAQCAQVLVAYFQTRLLSLQPKYRVRAVRAARFACSLGGERCPEDRKFYSYSRSIFFFHSGMVSHCLVMMRFCSLAWSASWG